MSEFGSHLKPAQSKSNHYHNLHDKNVYKRKAIDFKLLARRYPDTFGQFLCSASTLKRRRRYEDTGGGFGGGDSFGQFEEDELTSIDFKDINATISLTETLLLHDFSVSVALPVDRLCPPVPNRLDYLCNVSDLLSTKLRMKMDSGTTTNNSSSNNNSNSIRRDGNSASSQLKIELLVHPVLDIGTGASCIYPILGVQSFGWKFLASDIDSKSLEVARQNVWLNPCLRNMINFVKVPSCKDMQSIISKKLSLSAAAADGSGINYKSNSSLPTTLEDSNICNNVFNFSLSRIRGPVRTSITGEVLGPNPNPSASASNSLSGGSSTSTSTAATSTTTTTAAAAAADIVMRCESILDQWINCRRAAATTIITTTTTEKRGNNLHHLKLSNISTREEGSDYVTVDDLRTYIKEIAADVPIVLNAVMTNPPFYDVGETILENQHSICNGTEDEMQTVGGEFSFVMCMVADSIVLRHSVVWYSSMLGKRSSAIKLFKFLERDLEVPTVECRRISTGRTNRWIIAWSFYEKMSSSLPSSNNNYYYSSSSSSSSNSGGISRAGDYNRGSNGLSLTLLDLELFPEM